MARSTLLYIAIVVCLPHSGDAPSRLTNAIEAYSEVSATSKLKALVRGAYRSGMIKSPCDVFVEALVEITSIPVAGAIVHEALTSPSAIHRQGTEQSTQVARPNQIRHCEFVDRADASIPLPYGSPFLVLTRDHGVRARKGRRRLTKRHTEASA